MAVSSTKSAIAYQGNDVTAAFSFPYYFIDPTNLVVTLTQASIVMPQVLNVDYTVSGTATDGVYDAGGTVTMIDIPAFGEVLLIKRVTPLTQAVVYRSHDPFPAKSHEHALDKLTLIAQEGPGGPYLGYTTGPPASGTFNVGDWFIIYPPVAGGNWAIVCTSAGPPAVWNAFGGISL